MTANSIRRTFVALAMLATLVIAVDANAACCGGGGTSAYYPGSYNSYYSGSYGAYYPSAYQSYYSGWYPGYYWDRFRARVWGSPSTYVAAYPSSYYSGYAPAYTAAYRPAYSAGYATGYAPAMSYAAPASSCATCSTHAASYAPSVGYAAPSCSSCQTTASYAPSCPTCPTPCATCPTCPTGVSQAGYQQPANGCSSCGTGATVIQQSAPSTPTPAQTNGTYAPSNEQPGLPSDYPDPTTRGAEKQPSNGTSEPTTPSPGDDNTEKDLFDTTDSDGSTFFQAPKLFDPNDRTAQRSVAPVTKAVYHKPVSYQSVSTRPITAQQAQQDAVGWTSASE